MIMLKHRVMHLALCFGLILMACSERETLVKEEFASPESTYRFWLETAERGDIEKNMSCLTESSKKMMEMQLKNMDEFMKRLNVNLKVYRKYDIVDRKIENDNAIVVLKGSKGEVISVPLKKEAEGWKIDLMALFGGGQ